MPDTLKRRILVVDDEPSIAKVLRKQLEVAGFEVNVGVDGEDGLAKVRGWRPDLLVLDVMLPKRSGHEVCSVLRQDEQFRHLPILMLTAKAQRQDQEEAMQRGADAYLAKPFQLEELLGQIQTLLARSPATPESPRATPAT
jgi:two-component system phosphate regulon response regulator PhoB